MSLVKFAALCDVCARRSEEYSRWLYCLDCGRDLCGDCGPDEHAMNDDFEWWTPKENHA